jgi:hypothetical protein
MHHEEIELATKVEEEEEEAFDLKMKIFVLLFKVFISIQNKCAKCSLITVYKLFV